MIGRAAAIGYPILSDSDTKSQGQAKTGPVAVALAYGPESEFAPKVVAGGRGSIAEKILEIAFAHGIKVRQDADLAQLLSAIDIDDEIPVEAFAAVSSGGTWRLEWHKARTFPPRAERSTSQASATATGSVLAWPWDLVSESDKMGYPIAAARPITGRECGPTCLTNV